MYTRNKLLSWHLEGCSYECDTQTKKKKTSEIMSYKLISLFPVLSFVKFLRIYILKDFAMQPFSIYLNTSKSVPCRYTSETKKLRLSRQFQLFELYLTDTHPWLNKEMTIQNCSQFNQMFLKRVYLDQPSTYYTLTIYYSCGMYWERDQPSISH